LKWQERETLHQKKSLGQVFLQTTWPVERMVAKLVELGVEDALEIGPGPGILTKALLDAGMRVTAVEKDERFAARLAGVVGEPQAQRLTVISADILNFDLADWLRPLGDKVAVVGNIPYNISSPLVLHALQYLGRLRAILLMTQREFAERLASPSSSKNYGSLTVYAQLRAQVTIEFLVERTCFSPVPKVDSAVFLATARPDRLPDATLDKVERVTRTAFTQRRKKLRNAIKSLLADADAPGCPIDLERRPDHLTPEEYVALTEFLGV